MNASKHGNTLIWEGFAVKRMICLALILLLVGATAFAAAPQLSDTLFQYAKQAVVYLSSGEYERLVTLLPFSDVAPSASEWERFAGNFASLSGAQYDYAVGYWTGTGWNIAVPLQAPEAGSVETLVLNSDDGSTFCGYRYATWSQVEAEYTVSEHVIWNKEYVSGAAMVVTD